MIPLLLATSALAHTVAASNTDLSADMKCLVVATRLGGTGKGDLRDSGPYMTEYFLGRIQGRASLGGLARSFQDVSRMITQDNLEQESNICMMKFLQANEDLKNIGRQADDLP